MDELDIEAKRLQLADQHVKRFRHAGIDTVHIPFKLLSDAVTEMMSGRVHYYVFPVTAAVPLLKEGRLRPLIDPRAMELRKRPADEREIHRRDPQLLANLVLGAPA